MNKKNIIIIAIILVIVIAVGWILFTKSTNKQNEANYSYEIKTEEERKEIRKESVGEIETLLKDGGLNLKNKQECVESYIEEEGYSYQVDGQTIEIYEVDGLKLEKLVVRNKKTLEVNLTTQKGRITAICFNNTLILNADKELRQKIMNILQEN